MPSFPVVNVGRSLCAIYKDVCINASAARSVSPFQLLETAFVCFCMLILP